MAWLKRNYVLVVAGVVGLALLGLAGFYLMKKKADAEAADANLKQATAQLTALYKRKPYPNTGNIASAKEDLEKTREFSSDLNRFFQTPALPERISNRELGLLVDKTRRELEQTAKRFDVKVPEDYKFTFGWQGKQFDIATNLLESLAIHLADIDAICRVVLQAKVNSLESIKRPSVDKAESLDMEYFDSFLRSKPVTNEWTILTPYEVTFLGFTGDLEKTLDGFAQLPNCIVVTNLAAGLASASPDQFGMPGAMGGPSMMDLDNRYGLRPGGDGPQSVMPGADRLGGSRYGNRYGITPTPSFPQAPWGGVARPRSSNLLEEQLLRFKLSLIAVRLKEAPKPPQTAGRGP